MNIGDTVNPVSERQFVLLSDDNRFVRKKALTDIKEELLRSSKEDEKGPFPFATCAPRLTNALNDPVEVNRELATQVNKLLLECAPDIDPILPSLFPVLLKRLGQKEIVEPSEELRLELLNLLQIVVTKARDVNPYVDDILIVVRQSLNDSFHEVKKLSCSILQEVASKKSHKFYQNSEMIVAPMLGNLVHQHSKVRVCTVLTIGRVLMNSQGKLVDQAISPLTQRLFDCASSVRKSVIEVVGSWLLDLPDRYSYHAKLLPLLLSGLIDHSEDIRSMTEDYWHDIGLKFEKENEEQLKDKLDFDRGPPFHYPLGCRRPNLGCRELVYRSASRLLPALCRDLGDWQAATRSKAAGLISVLILHLEHCTTQHTQHLLTGLTTGLADVIARVAPSTNSVALLRLLPPLAFRAVPVAPGDLSVNRAGHDTLVPRLPTILQSGSAETSEALAVTQQLLLAAQLIGALVESKLWWPLIKSCLERCTESVAPTSLAAHLFLLAGLISGSSCTQLAARIDTDADAPEHNILSAITRYLAQDDLISVVSFGSKAALLECALVIIRRLEEGIMYLLSPEPTNQVSDESVIRDIDAAELAIRREMSAVLLADAQLRSDLFTILLALGAVWPEGDSAATDFGMALIQLADDGMRRLAACERDQKALHQSQPQRLQSEEDSGRTDSDDDLVSMLQSNLLASASPKDLNRLYTSHMLPLFNRLDADCALSGSWHPRSVGLAIFSRCLQTAGSALLSLLPTTESNCSSSNECLTLVLQLLERGCRLDRAPGSNSDKAPGGTDPLTIASEAELRLRGLILLTRLTDNGPVRTALSSPAYLSRCLTQLVLPVCVWRAGRTAEAMRKAATTCLVALIAAATSIYDIDEASVDARTEDEVRLDTWLAEKSESVRHLLGPKVENLDRTGRKLRTSSLPDLSAPILSLLLARIGGLLEDDLEATRRMSCLNLTLLFNGLLLPSAIGSTSSTNSVSSSTFLTSPAWLLPSNAAANDASANVLSSPVNEISCPLPNSFGDQVYRFYPNLIKRLNDAKDQIRLLVTETLNAWLRLVHPMLVCGQAQSASGSPARRALLNPVHTAVMEDFITGVLPHLDDLDGKIRAAVARVLARVCHLAPDLCRRVLTSARERHRSPELCDTLLEYIRTGESTSV